MNLYAINFMIKRQNHKSNKQLYANGLSILLSVYKYIAASSIVFFCIEVLLSLFRYFSVYELIFTLQQFLISIFFFFV